MKQTAQSIQGSSAVSFKRDPARTRETILSHAYQHIHEFGFQKVSLDAILRDTGVTKGAFYHHFPNKNALGYAVIVEVIEQELVSEWVEPLLKTDDPLGELITIITQTGDSMTMEELKTGCPLNNLSQEMSTLDEGFRLRIEAVYDRWRGGLASAIKNGIKQGTVNADIEPESVAAFIIASLEGCIGMAKNAQSFSVLQQCGAGVIQYLQSLQKKTGD